MIASFETPDSVAEWVSVNDGVMGGVSTGYFERTDQNTLLFKGELSLENNGGFASIRSKPQELDLADADGIRIRARGDGRTYWVGLRTARQFGASSYRAYMATVKGEFKETFIPFSDFKLQAFGRQLPSAPVDPGTVVSVGFTIADKKAGPFELEIAWIKAADQGLTPEPEATEPLSPKALVDLAIERGVPLFNEGNPAACAAVYEVCCEALRSHPEVAEAARQDLIRALTKMRKETSARDKAWILRYALDRFLAEQ